MAIISIHKYLAKMRKFLGAALIGMATLGPADTELTNPDSHVMTEGENQPEKQGGPVKTLAALVAAAVIVVLTNRYFNKRDERAELEEERDAILNGGVESWSKVKERRQKDGKILRLRGEALEEVFRKRSEIVKAGKDQKTRDELILRGIRLAERLEGVWGTLDDGAKRNYLNSSLFSHIADYLKSPNVVRNDEYYEVMDGFLRSTQLCSLGCLERAFIEVGILLYKPDLVRFIVAKRRASESGPDVKTD